MKMPWRDNCDFLRHNNCQSLLRYLVNHAIVLLIIFCWLIKLIVRIFQRTAAQTQCDVGILGTIVLRVQCWYLMVCFLATNSRPQTTLVAKVNDRGHCWYWQECYFDTDMNECATENGGCVPADVATCSNNVGSFTCECLPGYSQNSDGLNCEGKLMSHYVYILDRPIFCTYCNKDAVTWQVWLVCDTITDSRDCTIQLIVQLYS